MTVLGGEIRVYSGLKYLRTEGDFHIFKLPFAHPGHDHFRGCSGAPVLSEGGKLVGLVSGGDIPTNVIRVLSLAAYKTPIDIEVGKFR
jgi:CBS domain-containing protein